MNNDSVKQIHVKFSIFRTISYVILYGIFGVLLFSYLRSYLCILFLVVFAAVPLADFIFTLRLSRCVSLKLYISDEHIVCGENIGIMLGVENSSFFTSLKCVTDICITNSYYKDEGVKNFECPVMPKRLLKMPVVCKTSSVGKYTISIKRFSVYGLLGLVYFCRDCDISDSFFVLPQYTPLDDSLKAGLLAGKCDNEDETKKGNEYADTSDIREYIPGDRIKDIHWKLSAKREKLLVKERINTSENQVVIWMDSSEGRKLCSELLSVTYSLIHEYVKTGELCRLIWFDYVQKEVMYADMDNIKQLYITIEKLYDSSHGDTIKNVDSLLISAGLDYKSCIHVLNEDGEIRVVVHES